VLLAEAEQKRDPGLFNVLARVRDSRDVTEVRRRIESALVLAARDPIRTIRLYDIMAHLHYGFAGSLNNADAVAHAVGESIATTGRPDAMNDLFDAYTKLSPADLQRVAARYFTATNQTVVTLETETAK
jgi:zinc protease